MNFHPIRAPARAATVYACEACGRALPGNERRRFCSSNCEQAAFGANPSAAKYDGNGPLRAELTGSHTVTALGISVEAYAPALALCRALVTAGYDRATRLEAYRGPTLCLRVRSIGEGAALDVKSEGIGFKPYRGPRAASPMRQKPGALVDGNPDDERGLRRPGRTGRRA